MTYGNVLTVVAIIVLLAQSVWILKLTRKYNKMLSALGRASAQVAQHRLLVTELQQLIADDEDLNKCFQSEVEGKAFERAREVTYEQASVEKGDSMPWIPKENPK